jgi:hypothetical protein
VPAHSRQQIFLARGACADVDLIARWDGQMAGTLLRDDNIPASGVEIEARRQGDRFAMYATADDSGRFVFAGLAPDRYTIGTSLGSPPRAERPYATGAIRPDVTVGPGEHIALGTVRAPRPLRELALVGTVRFGTGRPPSDARVIVQPIWEGRPYVGTSVIISDDGAYQVVVLEGVEYEISVTWHAGRFRADRFVAGRSTPPEPLVVPNH